MDKIKITTTMPPGAWTDARIAAAETGVPAGDVLAQCLNLVLLRAAHARRAGDKRPAPDFALGFNLLMQDADMLDPAEADQRIAAWAERFPVPVDRAAGYAATLNRLAAQD
jgi:hypothetical protein